MWTISDSAEPHSLRGTIRSYVREDGDKFVGPSAKLQLPTNFADAGNAWTQSSH
jgi:hypothetical protein